MRPMSSPIVRTRLVIHGHVQGVFFRDSVRESAGSQGVSGWAANRDDGAVEVVLEGPAAAVRAVVEFCRLGPVRAQVDSVDERDEPPEGLEGFEIG
jgi:acylphosphatase